MPTALVQNKTTLLSLSLRCITPVSTRNSSTYLSLSPILSLSRNACITFQTISYPSILGEGEEEEEVVEEEMDGMRRRKEALVACGDKMSAGISVWDVETGELLLRIPTCAAPPHGLLCLQSHFLVASQLQNHRSLAGGAIFFWPLDKPRTPQSSYPIEEIGPIASTKDGIYLVGGAPSGNAYIWEVTSGRLLKTWQAHHTPLKCLAFSLDDSLLTSGSEDGVLCIWSTISVLNMEDPQAIGCFPPFHTISEHSSSISGLLSVSGGPSPALISSSLEGTCKVWDLISRSLLQTYIFPAAVTTIAVDPKEQMLVAGCDDGRIHVNGLDVGMQETPIVVWGDRAQSLSGHKGTITALTFSLQGAFLVSASKDGTACLWNAVSWQAIRRFNHGKGYITNLVFIPQSSLTAMENQKNCLWPRISLLDKGPHLKDAPEATMTLLKATRSQDPLDTTAFRTYTLFNKQLLDLEQERTPEAIQMKVETSVENRLSAITMAKHIMTFNKHLQSRLLDIIEHRLCHDSGDDHQGRRTNTYGPEEQTELPPRIRP